MYLLFFLEPAKIVIHPSPYSKVYPHQTVMSLCSAYGGDEPPTISWRFGDELLTNDSLDLVKIFETQSIHNGLVFTESILELCAVDLNDTGVYSCTATNSQGSDRYNFTLDVVPAGELLITTIIIMCALSKKPPICSTYGKLIIMQSY